MNCNNPDCPNPDEVRLHLVPSDDDSCKFLCDNCAQKLGYICPTHEMMRTAFRQGGHACLRCIEDDVRAHAPAAETLCKSMREVLPPGQLEALDSWAALIYQLMGDKNSSVAVLRAIMTAAHRRKIPYEQVVSEVISKREVLDILPTLF